MFRIYLFLIEDYLRDAAHHYWQMLKPSFWRRMHALNTLNHVRCYCTNDDAIHLVIEAQFRVMVETR